MKIIVALEFELQDSVNEEITNLAKKSVFSKDKSVSAFDIFQVVLKSTLESTIAETESVKINMLSAK